MFSTAPKSSGALAGWDDAPAKDVSKPTPTTYEEPSMCQEDECVEQLISDRFKAFDANGDGMINKDELVKVLTKIGIDTSTAGAIMQAADLDKDGSLSYDEFTNWVFGKASGARLVLCRSESAPFLKKYFESVKQASMLEQEASMMMLDGGGGTDKLYEQAAKIMQEAKPLLKQSFDRHDKSQTGRLCKQEASTFFSNVVAQQGAFAEMITAQMVKDSMKMVAKFMSQAHGDPTESAKFKQKMANTKERIEESVARQMIDYKANKASRDQAAFKVVDESGQGTITIAEFQEALTPDMPTNRLFLAALGLTPPDPDSV